MSRFKGFCKNYWIYRPANIDIYDYSLFTIIYVILSKLLSIRSSFWLIGGELYLDDSSVCKPSIVMKIRRIIKVMLTFLSLLLVDKIIAKEDHQVEFISRNFSFISSKVTHLWNCVPCRKSIQNHSMIPNKENLFLPMPLSLTEMFLIYSMHLIS